MKPFLSELLFYLRRFHRLTRQLIVLWTLDVFSAIAVMVPPLFAVLVFDYALPERRLKYLFYALCGGLVTYLFYIGITSWGDYLNVKLDRRIHTDLASDCFERIERAPLAEVQRLSVGDMMVRLMEDANAIAGFLVNLPSHLVVALVQLFIFFAIAIALDSRAALLGVFAFPLTIWQTHRYSKRLEAEEAEVRQQESAVYESLQEKLTNIRTIKLFCQQAEEKKRLHRLFARHAEASLRRSIISLYQTFWHSSIMQVWTLLVMAYLGFEVIAGRLTIGEMIALGIYLPLIQGPIGDLAKLWTQCRSGRVSLTRLRELLSLSAEEGGDAEQRRSVISTDLDAGLEFRNVSFAYEKAVGPILRSLDAMIRPRTMTAIVGASGMGKTTLISLLMNLYQPSRGTILLNGRNLCHYDPHELRRRMGVVFQETGVFSGTLRENILYGNPQATEGEMGDAAKKAGLHVLTQRPHGYETMLLPRGQNLSAGEQRRIALARALVMKPSVLVLDEVSHSLDAESGFYFQELLESLRHEMTIVLVTQGLRETKMVDEILLLGDGCIQERGTFRELMERKGKFFDLYHMQTGGFEEFQSRLDVEVERHLRYGEQLSLLLITPNAYALWRKELSSHQLLFLMEQIVLFVRRNLRIMDFCSLYRGEQVAIALPQTDPADAKLLAQRLIPLLQSQAFTVQGKAYQTTFSHGLSGGGERKWAYSESLFQAASLHEQGRISH